MTSKSNKTHHHHHHYHHSKQQKQPTQQSKPRKLRNLRFHRTNNPIEICDFNKQPTRDLRFHRTASHEQQQKQNPENSVRAKTTIYNFYCVFTMVWIHKKKEKIEGRVVV
jgi:hypothetical protein